MDTLELSYAIEALLFAQAKPMDMAAIRAALRRAEADDNAAPLRRPDEEVAAEAAAPADAPKASDAASDAAAAVAGADGGAPTTAPLDAADIRGPSAAALGDRPAVEGAGPAPEPFALVSPPLQPANRLRPSQQIPQALALLEQRWAQDPRRGFCLVQVGGGYTFRTATRFGPLLRAVREQKPQRLSRPALEALAIVAYRQPVTKPEVDHLRGVDSGGSLKVLLDRRLVSVVGKKEEPGRPLLYGTTAEFLHFFNLAQLADLPSLREFYDLTDDDQEAVRALEGLPDLQSLAEEGKNFRMDEAVSTDDLEAAVAALQRTQGATRAALLAQGVHLLAEDAPAERPAADGGASPTHH